MRAGLTRIWNRATGGANPHAALTLVYTTAVLTWIEYSWLASRVIERRLRGDSSARDDPALALEAQLTWAGATITLFLVLPAALQWGVHRGRLREIGWKLGGLRRHLWVYMAGYLAMVPLVWIASGREDFLATYPFPLSARQDLGHFWIWEPVYLLQFVALESFFRGYLLFRLERSFGASAVFIAAMPYAMIHWHKPALEAYGAILAGIVLGRLALTFRSWYGGALLHVLVAASMDLLAVWRGGLLGGGGGG